MTLDREGQEKTSNPPFLAPWELNSGTLVFLRRKNTLPALSGIQTSFPVLSFLLLEITLRRTSKGLPGAPSKEILRSDMSGLNSVVCGLG